MLLRIVGKLLLKDSSAVVCSKRNCLHTLQQLLFLKLFGVFFLNNNANAVDTPFIYYF